jgi:hypothetical protein
MNIVTCIHRRYILHFLCQLTKEYNVCSSVITDKPFCVSYGETRRSEARRTRVSSPRISTHGLSPPVFVDLLSSLSLSGRMSANDVLRIKFGKQLR